MSEFEYNFSEPRTRPWRGCSVIFISPAERLRWWVQIRAAIIV